MIALRTPAHPDLPAYRNALLAGYSPSSTNPKIRLRERDAIAADPDRFLASLDDPAGLGPPIIAPDGSLMPRLPGITRWIFAPGFAGSIGLRWQQGTEALPPHVLGHIGYGIVATMRNRGIATTALALLLPEAAARGLRHVDITTDPANIASRRVILKNGGIFIETFRKPESHGGTETERYRIVLPQPGAAPSPDFGIK